MDWKLVKDEIPPLNKQLLIGRSSSTEGTFFWHESTVTRPFDSDTKYHPDYYLYFHPDFSPPWQLLSRHHAWALVENPSEEFINRMKNG